MANHRISSRKLKSTKASRRPRKHLTDDLHALIAHARRQLDEIQRCAKATIDELRDGLRELTIE